MTQKTALSVSALPGRVHSFVAKNITQFDQAVGGTLGLAAVLSRGTTKSFVGVLGTAGLLNRSTAKSFVGTLGLGGALQSIRTYLVSVGGTLGLSGIIARGTSKGVGGTLALAGTVTRSIAKAISGVLGLAGHALASLVGGSVAKLDVRASDSRVTTITANDTTRD